MVIKNKHLVKIISKLFKIKLFELEFIFIRQLYDKDMSYLSFLRQSLDTFDEKSKEFRDEIKMEIRQEIKQQNK